MTKAELTEDLKAYKQLAERYYVWYHIQLGGNKSITSKEAAEKVEANFKALRARHARVGNSPPVR